MLPEDRKQTLLALTRLGIGHTAAEVPETIDWEALMDLAVRQGLLAVVLDGAQVLLDRYL